MDLFWRFLVNVVVFYELYLHEAPLVVAELSTCKIVKNINDRNHLPRLLIMSDMYMKLEIRI